MSQYLFLEQPNDDFYRLGNSYNWKYKYENNGDLIVTNGKDTFSKWCRRGSYVQVKINGNGDENNKCKIFIMTPPRDSIKNFLFFHGISKSFIVEGGEVKWRMDAYRVNRDMHFVPTMYFSDDKDCCLIYGRNPVNGRIYYKVGIGKDTNVYSLKRLLKKIGEELNIFEIMNIRDRYSNIPHDNALIKYRS